MFWPYVGPKKGLKIWPIGVIFHTHASTHNMPVNKVSWSSIKNFFEKMAKNLQNSNFLLLFVIKDPLKN